MPAAFLIRFGVSAFEQDAGQTKQEQNRKASAGGAGRSAGIAGPIVPCGRFAI
jgi:hypothetical protein